MLPGTTAGAVGRVCTKHSRGRVSEQESGPGTAHFLLRLCKPQAEPSGNKVTVEESPAARAGFGGYLEESVACGGMRAERVGEGVKMQPRLSPCFATSAPNAQLAVGLFQPRMEKQQLQRGRVEARGARDAGLGPCVASPRGVGGAAPRRPPSGRSLSPRPLLPPHLSHSARDLRPRSSDP